MSFIERHSVEHPLLGVVLYTIRHLSEVTISAALICTMQDLEGGIQRSGFSLLPAGRERQSGTLLESNFCQ